MNKFLYFNLLFSTYKELLTKREQEIFSSYYEENLSMGEIAENRSISRSAVGNTIKIVEKKLEKYENLLQIVSKNNKIEEIIKKVKEEEIKKELEKLLI